MQHLSAQPAFVVDFEQVERNVLGRESEHGFQVTSPRLAGLMRQTGYQIQADVGEAHATRAPHQLARVCRRMQPPHSAEFLVLEGLCSNAQTIYTQAHGTSQEFGLGRAWRDFDREFAPGLHPKSPAKSVDNPLKSFRPQQRRGSSPEIDCIHRECENTLPHAASLKVGWQPVDLLFQRIAISVEETGRLDSRTEIAERALRGAKWNLNIDAKRLH
jgi:hypothetical protein